MKKASIIVDLGYGDAGKGTFVDFLTREYKSDLTVRFSGGSQCAHNVVDAGGNHHMFSQFGAGSLAGSRTLLTKDVLINPLNLLMEEERLARLIPDPFNNLFIEEDAVVITPYHRAINKLTEKSKGKLKDGSCGQGVWETRLDHINNPNDSIKISDLMNRKTLRKKIKSLKSRLADKLKTLNIDLNGKEWSEVINYDIEAIVDRYTEFVRQIIIVPHDGKLRMVNDSTNPVFEGNQGIGLDDIHGFFPYVTANSTTSENAIKLLNDCGWDGEREVIGATRTYTSRHGVGPLVTEDPELSKTLNDKHNKTNDWQDHFRFGWLDFNLLNYSIEVDGNIDSLAVSHVDELEKLDIWKVCNSYQYQGFLFWLVKQSNPTVKNQAVLTNTVKQCQPNYDYCSKNDVLREIPFRLEKDIKIKSFGPRSDQKELL